MSTPVQSSTLPNGPPAAGAPAAAPAAGGRGRLGAAVGVAALVLWLHGLLIGALAPGLPQRAGPEGQVRPAAMQVSLQVRPAAAPTSPPSAGATAPPAPPVRPTQRTEPATAAPTLAPAPTPPAGPLPTDIAADPSSAAAGDPDATPPPVYPTRIPPPVQLRFALRYNGQAGEAVLDWRHDGRQYTLDLDGRDARQALVLQASRGGFDAAGLAPERYTDRRRGSRLQAANFQRDTGRIGFSGPAVDYPAWPGAQDRLSWLPQFVAIHAAAPSDAALRAISLFVVDARGGAALWHFQPQGEVELATPSGTVPAQHWRREPARPEGLRVEVWLGAAPERWPVQLRFTALRSGDVFELRRLQAPVLPP